MRLYSNILGHGEPFVILHGFLGMSDNWKSLGVKYAELQRPRISSKTSGFFLWGMILDPVVSSSGKEIKPKF